MASFHLSSALLKNLKSLFPDALTCTLKSGDSSSVLRNPWFIVASVAFSASNRPEAVPFVFEQALRDLKSRGSDKSEELMLARKMREALFRSGLISGYPKVINSLKALHEVMPIELQDKEVHRNTQSSSAYEASGQKLWQSVYGEKADHVQALLNEIYPDMGWFSKTIGYGLIYAPTEILSPLENSYTLIAALIAGDTPQQIIWHLDGARRAGATLEEVQAVRDISIEVAKLSGISWRHSIPQVDAEEV